MRFGDVMSTPSGYEVMQLQNRMDTLGYERSLPGVWGDPESGFVQFYAQQIGLDVNTASGDAAIEQVLPVVDSDIEIAKSGALRSAPPGGRVTSNPVVISGQVGPAQAGGDALWDLLAVVLGAKLLGFF